MQYIESKELTVVDLYCPCLKHRCVSEAMRSAWSYQVQIYGKGEGRGGSGMCDSFYQKPLHGSVGANSTLNPVLINHILNHVQHQANVYGVKTHDYPKYMNLRVVTLGIIPLSHMKIDILKSRDHVPPKLVLTTNKPHETQTSSEWIYQQV